MAVQDTPGSHLQSPIDATLNSRVFIEKLNAWTLDTPWLAGCIESLHEFFEFRVRGDSSGTIGAIDRCILLEDADVVSIVLQEDTMHETCDGAADLQCWSVYNHPQDIGYSGLTIMTRRDDGSDGELSGEAAETLGFMMVTACRRRWRRMFRLLWMILVRRRGWPDYGPDSRVSNKLKWKSRY